MNKKVNSDPIGTVVKLMSSAMDDMNKAASLMDSKVATLVQAYNNNCISHGTLADNLYNGTITVGDVFPNTYPTPYVGDIVGGGCSQPWTSPIINIPQYNFDYGSYPKIDIRESHYWSDENGTCDGDGGQAGDGISWRVDIYAAGVPEEDFEIELTEGTDNGTVGTSPTLMVRINNLADKFNNNVGNNGQKSVSENYFLREGKQTAALRIVSLPADADVHTTTEATIKDGVLTFWIRKKQKIEPPKKATVKIKK